MLCNRLYWADRQSVGVDKGLVCGSTLGMFYCVTDTILFIFNSMFGLMEQHDLKS
jgi:hypothetical protein